MRGCDDQRRRAPGSRKPQAAPRTESPTPQVRPDPQSGRVSPETSCRQLRRWPGKLQAALAPAKVRERPAGRAGGKMAPRKEDFGGPPLYLIAHLTFEDRERIRGQRRATLPG